MRTRTIASSGALNLIAQIAVLGVLYLTAHEGPLTIDGPARALLLAVVAVVPSAIWAAFFYLQDRHQPEPTANVVMAFASGMGAAAALAIPAETHLFRLGDWIHDSPWMLMMGATLVRGALAAVLLYAILRYGFMPAADFDEPVDGLAYGAFIGSGFAAAWSLDQGANHPDFTLFAHAYAAATNVLVYASVGALTGYLVGRAKFQLRPASLSYAEAIAAGAALMGVYHVVAEYAFLEEASNPIWISVAATVAFSLAVLALATWLMRRLTARSEHRSRPVIRTPDLLPIAVAAALFAGGALVSVNANAPVAFAEGGLAFVHPRDYVSAAAAARTGTLPPGAFGRARRALPQAGQPIFSAQNRDGTRIGVRRAEPAESIDRLDPLPYVTSEDPRSLTISEHAVAGQRAMRVRYAWLSPRDAAGADLPRARWTIVDVVPAAGATYIFTVDALPEHFDAARAAYERLLSTVRWPS